MPCTCDGYPPSEEDIRHAQSFRLLCSLLQRIEDRNCEELIGACDELKSWWDGHKKWDAKRKKEESEHQEKMRLEKEQQFEKLKRELGK